MRDEDLSFTFPFCSLHIERAQRATRGGPIADSCRAGKLKTYSYIPAGDGIVNQLFREPSFSLANSCDWLNCFVGLGSVS